jgi:hypothetical protein
MQKLGLLTLPLRRATVTLPASQIAPSGEGLRKVGLATYSSDQPYRDGRDVMLSRWDELGAGPAGRAKTRRIGLLTLS